MERIFFHDILNTAGAIRGLIQLFKNIDPESIEKHKDILMLASERLIEEIKNQRDLVKAENNELMINPQYYKN